MREYASYLPDLLRDVREFSLLDQALTPEHSDLSEGVALVVANTNACTAESLGLARFERMLGLSPEPGADCDSRRFDVLSRLQNNAAFTLRWLINKLDTTLDRGGCTVTIEGNVLTIEVDYLHRDRLLKLKDDIRRIIPAHLYLNVADNATSASELHAGVYLHVYDQTDIQATA